MTTGWIELALVFGFGLLAGAGGFAGLHRFLVRPRPYYRFWQWTAVPLADSERRETANAALRQRSLPTHFARVEWWNQGKRTAKDVEIALRVPGQLVEYEVEPSESDNVRAPWNVVEDPADGAGNRIRLRQSKLRPGAQCTMIVGYWGGPEAGGDCQPHVFVGDREVKQYWDPFSWRGLALLGLCLAFGFFWWVLRPWIAGPDHSLVSFMDEVAILFTLIGLGVVFGVIVGTIEPLFGPSRSRRHDL